MLELICKRLLLAIPTLLLVSMMVFGLQKLLPGDPLIAMAGEERDPAVIAQLRAELNLDAPIPVQYFNWLTCSTSLSTRKCEVNHGGTDDANRGTRAAARAKPRAEKIPRQ